MKARTLLCLCLLALSFPAFAEGETAAPAPAPTATPAAAPAPAEEAKNDPFAKLHWIGPGPAQLGDVAKFDVPEGGAFLDKQNTDEFMKITGNSVNSNDVGAVFRKAWGNGFVIFSFDDIGYVSDEEKDKIDADAILKSISEGTEASNEEKKKADPRAAGIHVVGWRTKPSYNPATNHLEWAIDAKNDDGTLVVNHQIRMLGRNGVMKVTLVGSPQEMEKMIPDFQPLLAGYSFNTGQKYAEYRQGDKVAAVGLTALVAGGAAAVALKSGLLQKFGKAIALAVFALFAGLRKFMGGFFGKKKEQA